MTDNLRIVIVDDEPLARAVVREYADGDPTIEVVADCANGFEAVKAVADLKPDLVLLDVQMPKLDGFEVLELIGPDVPVVFVTAYDEFALKAFEVHAVDYLLKPVAPERLLTALNRARERVVPGKSATRAIVSEGGTPNEARSDDASQAGARSSKRGTRGSPGGKGGRR